MNTKSIHIKFTDGSNPYVRFNMTDKEFKKELMRWRRCFNIVSAEEKDTFLYLVMQEKNVNDKREIRNKAKNKYSKLKNRARNTAIEWQSAVMDKDLSYEELVEAQEHFTKLGRRYGLLAEFRENCII